MVPKNKTAKDLWKPKRRIELMYLRMLKVIGRELKMRIANLNTPSEILKEIKKFTKSKEFNKYAEASAMKIVTHLFTDAGHTWRQAAHENGKGAIMYKALEKELKGSIGGALNSQIKRNAAIIKTLPLDISEQVTKHVMTESLKGKRASDIADEIKQWFPHTTTAKANLIARTETSKTSSALTQSRAESIGLKWYVWQTSTDQRTRKSHLNMQGVLVNYDNPPSPEKLVHEKDVGTYNAGNIYNCRCYSSVVINIDYIEFPHKVYTNGKIVRMTKEQFKKIM